MQYLVHNQQAALKALALARRHDLTAASYSLSKQLAAAALQSGQAAAALQWALQARDPQLCAELVAPLIAKVQQQLLAQVRATHGLPIGGGGWQVLQAPLVCLETCWCYLQRAAGVMRKSC